jgi:hypothetical protein
VFVRSLKRTIERLRAADKNVVVIGGVPRVGWDVPIVLGLCAQHRVSIPEPPSRRQIERQHEFVDRAFTDVAEQDGVSFIPISNLLCSKNCLITAENRPLYSDHNHLSLFGARRFLGPALRSEFRTWPP